MVFKGVKLSYRDYTEEDQSRIESSVKILEELYNIKGSGDVLVKEDSIAINFIPSGAESGIDSVEPRPYYLIDLNYKDYAQEVGGWNLTGNPIMQVVISQKEPHYSQCFRLYARQENI